MTVQIYRQYIFTDGTEYSNNSLDNEIDQIASTLNNANSGLLVWDNVKAVNLTSTNAPVFTAPLPIVSGGTASGTALSNNRVIVSSGSKIVETTALTSGQIIVANGSGLPVTGVTGSMNSTKITALANGSAASDAAAIGQIAFGTVNAAGYVIGTTVQIVQATNTGATTSSGTAYTSTGTTAAITPKASTHQIKISVTGVLTDSVAIGTSISYASVFRGSTDLSNGNGFVSVDSASVTTNTPAAMIYVDSPASTSSVTYTVKIKSSSAAQAIWNNNTGTCVILLEEIAQ